MTQMVSAEHAAALRNKCLNLAKSCLVTASTPEPEGGARCVSSARRDLCGGARSNPRPYRDHGHLAKHATGLPRTPDGE